MNGIKERLEQRIDQGSISEISKITSASVKAAAATLKKGKADVSGSYSSDAIRNAPDSLYKHLAAVYRSFLMHCSVPWPLLACAFMPLLKSTLKDPANTKSYWAIAGSSTLLMLFDKLVLGLWGDQLASRSLQMGYKLGSSTGQCSYILGVLKFHTISVEVLYFNHCCVWVFRAGLLKNLSFPTIFLK